MLNTRPIPARRPEVLPPPDPPFHSIEIRALLADAVSPTMYRSNGFRVLELSVEASPRDIHRRKQTLEKSLAHAVPVPPGSGRYFPLNPSPDAFAVRDAVQRLGDPRRRLVDELFWFWPEQAGEAGGDCALTLLRDGRDREAEGLWLESEANADTNALCSHNLALLYHFRALEQELRLLAADPDASHDDVGGKLWSKSFARWQTLSQSTSFWKRVEARVLELRDPRLSSGMAAELRTTLPAAIISINARLAVSAAESGRMDSASRLMETIGRCGFDESAIASGVQLAIDPVLLRLKSLCRTAELATKSDPAQADRICRQLTSDAVVLLDAMDRIVPQGHPSSDAAHDDVATRALECQVAFVAITDNWRVSVDLLSAALPVARSESIRDRIQEILEIVRKNADANDDFRGVGYHDAPALLLDLMEHARQLALAHNFDGAVECLEALLDGKTGVPIADGDAHLVRKALAYCLGTRANSRDNEATTEWNDHQTTSVMRRIQNRVHLIDEATWRCASTGTIPSYVRCRCMADGTLIDGQYSVVTCTFNNEKGPATLLICGACATRHRTELDGARTSLKGALRQIAQDYVDAAVLDPANKFVRGRLDRVRQECSEWEVPIPSARRRSAGSMVKAPPAPSPVQSAQCAAPPARPLPAPRKWWAFWR